MKLVNPKFEIIEQQEGLEGIYKQIELAGRTCYKSEYNITPTSAKKFVDNMINSGHGAMLEHGTVYLQFTTAKSANNPLDKYYINKYSASRTENGSTTDTKTVYITTNLRVLVENGWLNDLKYLCELTKYHEKRVCVRFTCDRGVSHEFVRHRVFSFAQESTRYCNYSSDRFGEEITFIIPSWVNIPEGKYTNIAKQDDKDGEYKQIMLHENNINAYPLTTTSEGRFLWNCCWSEYDYFSLLDNGWKPQQARQVLPNALKTELVMTGFISDWEHFFELRDDSHAHPDAQALAKPLHEEFIKRGYIK